MVPTQRSDPITDVKTVDSVSFPPMIGQKCRLKAAAKTHEKVNASMSQTRSCSVFSKNLRSGELKERRVSGDVWLHAAPERDLDNILSLHSISSMYNFGNIESLIPIQISEENCT